MGTQRRHRVEREPAQGRPRASLRRAPERDDGVLELQRSAGNRAVADQLQVARDATVPTDTETKKGATLTLDDLGSFEIDSFAWEVSGTGARPGKPAPRKLVISTTMAKLGTLAPRLAQIAAEGRRVEKADITSGSTPIHLKDVYISTYQIGSGADPTVTFSLDAAAIDFGDKDKDKEGDGGGSPGYDL